jgi:hypothetical protein
MSNLLELSGKKEVEEKIFHCFRSIALDDNLDTVRYFVCELNVKISDVYRKNLEKQLPKVEEILASRDLKDELDIELLKNKQHETSKQIKI